METLVHAKVYDGEGALSVGYVDELAAPDKVFERALEVAAELGKLPGFAYAETKRRVRGELPQETARQDFESFANMITALKRG